MFCRHCGVRLDGDQAYCKSCGKLPLRGKAYCQNCGLKTNNEQVYCTHCHIELIYKGYSETERKVIDEPNTLANFGTFCCNPIIGVILYIVWKDNKPIAAQSVCNWTIARFVVGILFFILYIIFMIGIGFKYGR